MTDGQRRSVILIIIVALGVSLACQALRDFPLGPEDPPATAAATTAADPTPGAAPNYADVGPVTLVDQGFAQEEHQVGYGFIVENPNADVAIEGTGYEVIAYDEAGTVLGGDEGMIRKLAPGARWGVGGRLSLNAKLPVATLEIDLRSGDAVAPFPEPDFRVEMPTIFTDPAVPRATAVLHNPYLRTVVDLPVSVVAFDGAGAVVGGGYTYVDFVPGEGQAGVQVSLLGLSKAAEVAFYPYVSGFTDQVDPGAWPEGATAPTVVNQGFAQDARRLGWGIELDNANEAHGIQGLQVRVDVFDAAGTVLGVQEGRIHLVMPGQRMVFADELWLPEGQRAAEIAITVLPDAFVAAAMVDELPRFAGEAAAFEPATYSDRVTGRIANPSSLSVTDIRVSAVLYDLDGAIVGGGYTYLDLVPAEGRAAVTVRVVVPESAGAADVRPVLGAVLTSLTESR